MLIHQSPKDTVPFQGSDVREFWQWTEDRSVNTTELYVQLGLIRYAAMDAFVRKKYQTSPGKF
ncbi:MAG TPA: hypothetical protein VEV15_00640 [Flavisolibacter sp.]|nr:hypothetical protein [Flavisolibacter sp.]